MLTPDPKQDFVINGDIEAKAFLASLGVLDEFVNQSSLASGTTQMITCSHCKTHWVAALLFTGHKKKIDNGYMVFAWSKDRHGLSEVNEQIEKVWREFLRVPFEHAKYFRIEPEKN